MLLLGHVHWVKKGVNGVGLRYVNASGIIIFRNSCFCFSSYLDGGFRVYLRALVQVDASSGLFPGNLLLFCNTYRTGLD